MNSHLTSAQSPKPIRLLVIEDNDDDRVLLARQIKRAKIEDHVFFTDSSAAGINILLQDVTRTIFAVFVDLKLREGDGLEVLRHIRSHPLTKLLPVIVMTGSSNRKDLEECNRLNVTCYLHKPVTFSSFCKSVAGVFHLPR